MSDAATSKEQVAAFQKDFRAIEAELGKVIVGHHEVIRSVLTALFAGGHCLLEGVPGLGKTLLVRTLGSVLQLKFNRVQFTPDLMPADILGTNLVAQTPQGDRVFKFQPGPIFTQIALADEINRATPKTQSAMLEAMLDRFLFKIMVSFSSLDELRRILERTTDKQNVQIDKVIDGPRVLAHQALVKDVVAAPHVKD